MKYIITVPHAACEDKPFRTCDTRAEQSGNVVYEVLKQLTRDEITVVRNEMFRRLLDGNRYASRGTKFRDAIKGLLGPGKWIIDVHSFPNTLRSFGSVNGTVPWLVILAPPEHFRIYKRFEREAHWPVLVLMADDRNDILMQGREYGSGGVLLEFNESYEAFPLEQQKQLVRGFLEFFIAVMQKYPGGGLTLEISLRVVYILCIVIILVMIYLVTRCWFLAN